MLVRLIAAAVVTVPVLALLACWDDPTVPSIQLLTMHPDSVEIAVGATTSFEVEGRDRLGAVAEHITVTWQVIGATGSIEEVSSTTSGLRPTMTVRGLQPGTAYVRASVDGGAARTGRVVVLPEG
jgi:hypothetical protein